MRMNIECAFGEIIRRWGIFWRALEIKFDRRGRCRGPPPARRPARMQCGPGRAPTVAARGPRQLCVARGRALSFRRRRRRGRGRSRRR